MSAPVIEVRGLTKYYRLGALGAGSLREEIGQWLRRLRHRSAAGDRRDFCALRDVSFDVQAGEIVGVIGRNGAGKSTLLKLLSRVTEPTGGRAVLRGRVGSLLEVGTGFHPDLSGRDNIFLNGAILGMKRAEIRGKFDEIVAFAEVEQFIDTPVKRYSSGMYVRLAFAVAAHLEPEILIIDEVLAVGDAAFQAKCLGKVQEVSAHGRTVLVVSHNMASVMNLCTRGLVLANGQVVFDGATQAAVEHYLASGGGAGGEVVWASPAVAPGNDLVRLHSVRVCQDAPAVAQADVDITKPVAIEIEYWNLKAGASYYAALWLADCTGTVVLASANARSVSSTADELWGKPLPTGRFRARCELPANFLNEGLYRVTAIIGTGVSQTLLKEDWIVSFHAHDSGAMRREYYGQWIGVVRPRLAWQTHQLEAAPPVAAPVPTSPHAR